MDKGWDKESPLSIHSPSGYSKRAITCMNGQWLSFKITNNKCSWVLWRAYALIRVRAKHKVSTQMQNEICLHAFVNTHISLKTYAHTLVIVYDSTHSTHTVFTVAACPLTSGASKIEERPCGDLSHGCSCWVRSFGRQSKMFTCWAAELQKYSQGVNLYHSVPEGDMVWYSHRQHSLKKKLSSLSVFGHGELLLRKLKTKSRQKIVITLVLWVSCRSCLL